MLAVPTGAQLTGLCASAGTTRKKEVAAGVAAAGGFPAPLPRDRFGGPAMQSCSGGMPRCLPRIQVPLKAHTRAPTRYSRQAETASAPLPDTAFPVPPTSVLGKRPMAGHWERQRQLLGALFGSAQEVWDCICLQCPAWLSLLPCLIQG